MAYVDDFQYDLFISYPHVINHEGWVTTFHKRLEAVVNEVLGRSGAARIFFDERKLPKARQVTKQIQEAVTHSAVLVIVGSPAYLESPWCEQERNLFVDACGGADETDGRIFLVLYDELPLSQRPEPLQELVGFGFFEERSGVPATLRGDQSEYRDELNKLRRELAAQLKRMAGESELELPSEPVPTAPPVRRPTVKYKNKRSQGIAEQLRDKQRARLILAGGKGSTAEIARFFFRE